LTAAYEDNEMRYLKIALVAAMAGSALPVSSANAIVVQFTRDGIRYCLYRDGWHGSGWYQCGTNWHYGNGWAPWQQR
jgi:hypothetical protein